MLKNELIENLKLFNLDEVEIGIVLEVSSYKSITAVKLSRELSIPKTTLYHYLDVLVGKGFISVIVSQRGREYAVVKNVFEMKLNEAKVKYHKIKEVKRSLEKELFSGIPTLGNSTSKVYYGLDGVKQLLWNVLSAQTDIYYYTSASRKELFGEKWFTSYCDEFVLRNLHEKGFESDRNRNINPDVYFKSSPGYSERSEYILLKDVTFNGEVYIYNNNYSYYTWVDGNYFGVEIESASLAETQRKIFESFWNLVISTKSYIQKHEKSGIISIK
jgi:sugar-specific transcriptional regulator TrmB